MASHEELAALKRENEALKAALLEVQIERDKARDPSLRFEPSYEPEDQTPITWSIGYTNEMIWRAQIRDDGMNVISSKPAANLVIERWPRKKEIMIHRKIEDGHFRDHMNNILNTGQLFKFAHLKYRCFLVSLNGLAVYAPPEQPVLDMASADKQLKREIGVASDITPPTYRGKQGTFVTRRAGKPAYFKAIMPKPDDPDKDQYLFVAADGTKLNPGFIITDPEHTNKDTDFWLRLADKLRSHFGARVNTIRSEFEYLNAKWANQQKSWEWEVICRARENPSVRWPAGTTQELMKTLKYYDVISDSDTPIQDTLIPASQPPVVRPVSKRSFERLAQYVYSDTEDTYLEAGRPVPDIPEFNENFADNMERIENLFAELGYRWGDLEEDWKSG
ncbi:uncharacterized protein DSM5745_10083 [Aspergillus mulundensis]|uniref:Uncharacterized protein n=1 Tax=Aspergillus mulundensis TaxID=1810919 RepID=A0A3D8QME7_9EURO|nr:hypothetical protein DSM5745_10083 [Aspergillus mulundensis]RDW62972.1 hypothetical protein DSM5745_10083 [Aspergillus mulundensis]